MKKLLFMINYFYPDSKSTSQLMTDLCNYLSNEYEVIVIASQDDIKKDKLEFIDNIKVYRLKTNSVNKNSKLSRLKYINDYFLKALKILLKEKKVDLIYSISQPPVLGGVLGVCGKFLNNAKFVYNIQDFNPEQAIASGFIKNRFLLFVAKYIDKLSCLYSDKVILVGRDMVDTFKKRHPFYLPSYEIINNWTDDKEIIPLLKKDYGVKKLIDYYDLDNKFIVMYSGNIGLYYDLENLIKITKEFSNFKDLTFVFIGDGAKKPELEKYVAEEQISNVKFLPFQPLEELKHSLNIADVHLVVNQKGIKGVSVPSKIYGVLAAGKPIVGVLEKNSEAEQIISKSGAGITIEPQNYNKIIEAIKFMYNISQEQRESMGIKGRKYLEENFKKEKSLIQYKNVIDKILK